MKIGIIGAGAMGLLFAYYIQKAGNEVAVYEKSKDAAASLRGGFAIDFGGRKEEARVTVSENPSVVKDSAYVFVFVKSFSTAEAVKEISPFITRETRLISLQNGIGNDETIKDILPDNILIYGTTTFGAAKTSTSAIRFGGSGNILIGAAGGIEIEPAVNFLNAAGLSASKSGNPAKDVWKKAIINAAINPLGALLGIPNGMIIKNEYSAELMRTLTAEAVNSARANGFDFNITEMRHTAFDVCEQTAVNECSMLQDIRARRRTEIESITGKIIAAAKKYNIETPANTGVYQLIKALESGYLAP
ncbi:MAG: 2-dehydropantoate 2-reductase [Leptospirales bacterium]|nr:2-dehydropantoate 2-reductase [Leptospirales bacterium]